MNSFISWIGGKKALREEIVRRFPLSYEKYIEVFGGAGWVLFHKPPSREEEFFNDFNPNLTNLYLCVQDKRLKEELKAQLRWAVNSELAFSRMMEANKIPIRDPPYFGTEGYYLNVNFTRADHERLARVLLDIQGKFLLSYNDCPEIRALYDNPGIQIESIERLNNLRQQVEGGCMYTELFIANYDMDERRRSLPEQLYFTT